MSARPCGAGIPPVWQEDAFRIVKDGRAKVYVAPEKVLWKSSSDPAAVSGEDVLLAPGDGQAVLGAASVCRMKSSPEVQASLLLDFGRELQGGIRIVTGQYPSGKPVRIRVRFGESASEAMCEIDGINGACNDHAIRDMEIILPWLGTLETGNSGFRFVRIDLLDMDTELQLKEVNAYMVYRDIPYEGSFRSSDSRLDSIWMTGAYTVHLNLQNYLTEGVKRDRLVWVGDLHPEVMTVCSVFGYNDAVPLSLDLSRDTNPLPAWMNGISSYSIWWLLIQRDWYMHTGDLKYLAGQKEYLAGLLDMLISKVGEDGTEHLDGGRFLDWPSEPNRKAVDAGLHSLMVMAMDAGAGLCDILGESSRAKRCRRTLELLKKSSGAASWLEGLSRDNPSSPGNKQAAALMTLSGEVPAAEACDKCIMSGGAAGFSTFYGYYMLEAMAAAGRYSEAMDMIRSYWGGMLDLGATTFWEDFDLSWKDNAARIDSLVPEGKKDVHRDYGGYCYKGFRHSLCHGWASGPTSWLSRHVLGIEILFPGCRKIRVTPHLGDLEWVEGTFPTPFGPVYVRHEKNGCKVISEIKAPKGVKVVK
ncbi:MAG: alpha-L-rhamnosidase [Bacteroidetes bacterium]|uniref:Alpha-L-rhamnosidase n=1 Tax=Candidatus Cryptobacteroides faecipullorum TaxID=2840764 RepID=A0A9D9NAP5_9BACT|nr:alpha-L-rhamnosidase [Candidatus Cryptobacteroides faecipullorum]